MKINQQSTAILTLMLVCVLCALANLAGAQSYVPTFLFYNTNGIANLQGSGGNNRGLACSVVSNQVYVADRNSTPGHISVWNGTSGALLSSNLPGITIAPYNVVCADDGVIYAAPLQTSASGSNLALYSWTNWLSTQVKCYTPSGSDATANSLVVGNRVGDTMAVFGGGMNTEVAMWINGPGSSTHATTNLLVFTTADGLTFTPTLISITGLPLGSDAGPQHGFVFLDGTHILFRNGFGSSTYEIQFPANFASMSSPVTASVIATNTTLPSGGGSDVYLFSYSPAGKLLADYGQILSSGSPTSLGLYDVSSFPTANSLGSTNTPHYNSNGNFTGGVALGGQGKTNALYVLDSNNGIWGFSLSYIAAAVSPVITSAPVGGSVYTNYGPFTFSATAVGSAPLTYIWQYNTVSNLATASTLQVTTNNYYTISNLTVSASGWYDVVVTNIAGVTNSLPVQLTVSTALTSAYVTNLWALPADNSAPYLDTSYNTRGLAFDPSTMSVLVAEHSAAQIYALNATNGQLKFLTTTPLTGLPAGSIFPLGQVGVADDGVVYACNVSSYQPGQQTGGVDFSITRFDSVVTATNGDGSINPNNTFEAAFTGDPGSSIPNGNYAYSGGDRWGDSMAVRGAGTNTQILLGTYETLYSGGSPAYGTGPGTNVSILTTSDGVNFTPITIAVTNAPDGFSYLGVAWGLGNTFWTKSPNYDLREVQYDLNSGYGWVIQDISSTPSSGSLASVCGIGLDVTNNILAGVNVGDVPNNLELFQIPTGNNLADAYYQAFFPVYNPNINGNAATTVKFPYIFSLDANNGIIGLEYSIPLLPFSVTSQIVGNHQILMWPTVVGHTYQLQATNSLAGGTNAWPNIGSAVTVPASGSLSYTNTSFSGATLFYRVMAQ